MVTLLGQGHPHQNVLVLNVDFVNCFYFDLATEGFTASRCSLQYGEHFKCQYSKNLEPETST